MPRDADSIRAMNALRRLVSALRSSGAAASGDLGMSVAQLFALRTIGRHARLSMGELAERTLTTPGAVSEVAARLVARGFVTRERDPLDHRRLLLHLTGEGRDLYERLPGTLPERLIAALAGMNPMARGTLADGLESWVRDAGLERVEPSLFGEGSVENVGSSSIR